MELNRPRRHYNHGYYREGYKHGRAEGEVHMRQECVRLVLEEIVVGDEFLGCTVNNKLREIAEKLKAHPPTVPRTKLMDQLQNLGQKIENS